MNCRQSLKISICALLFLGGRAGSPVPGTRVLPCPPGSLAEITLAVINGTVIDGTGAPAIADGVVLIKGKQIVSVGRKKDILIPAGTTLLDARGGSILPGLIDSHVHNAFDPAVRRKFLKAGITSVCDLGSPISRMSEFDARRDGIHPAVRGFKAGPIFTAPGGLPDAVLKEGLNFEVASAAQARAGVQNVVRRGADVIKVYLHPSAGGKSYPMLTRETLGAIVNEAHALGKIVRAHVTQIAALPLALESGVDVIDHIPRPDLNEKRLAAKLDGVPDPMKKLYALVKIPEYDGYLTRLVVQKKALVTTLALISGGFIDPEKSTLPQRTVARALFDILLQFRRAGGRVALGTDFNPDSRNDPAALYFQEIDVLSAAGLTPLEIIAAATGEAASVSGHGGDLGSLAPGKTADLLVVGGNPLQDIRALRRIEAVILDGAVVER